MSYAGSGAPRILLVRHARPVVDPARPAPEWTLDGASEAAIILLARDLRAVGADAVVTSPEPKALGTAQILARELGLGVSEELGIAEQGGGAVPWIESQEAFVMAVAEHFARPHEMMLGEESSDDAVQRFAEAVERARSRHRYPVLVTHGRVMCGYIARVVDQPAMDIWAGLQMPDAIAVDLGERCWTRLGEGEEQ